MYDVSSAYKQALLEPFPEYKLRVKVGSTWYTGEDVIGGSLTVTNQCSETDIVQIGSVYTAALKCKFRLGLVTRNQWEGITIEVQEGIKLDNESYEYVPLGIFTVAEANHVEDGVQITAYDNMLKFDKSFNLSTTTGSAYSILALMCQDCGVELGMTEIQMAALPNGAQQISLYSENDCETYRDVVFWLAQTVGCFATIGRDGKLYLKLYPDGRLVETDSIDETRRFEGGAFSDFTTEYSGVSYVDIESQETKYVNDGQDNKLTYNLGANPFLQYGTESTKKQMAINILNALKKIYYTPFRTQYLNTPAYDLGDIIINEGGLGDGAVGCIMWYDYKYNEGYAVEGFGMNPALATARNKVDKNIAGLMSRTDKNSIQFYTFKNADEIVVGDNQTKQLMNIRFATAESKQVTFQAEILCDADVTVDDIKANILYYLDRDLITDYQPVETWSEDGKHIISLYYMIDVEPNTLYQWQVMMKSEGGTIIVPIENARGTIWGQGLVASDKWNGFIDVEDEVGAIPLDSILVAPFTDSMATEVHTPHSRAVEDTFGVIGLDDISVAQIDDYVILNKTSIYLDGMKWEDVYENTWGAIFDEHTW